MNFIEMLLRLFGGRSKPAPRQPTGRRAPPQPHPHEQDVSQPDAVHTQTTAPERHGEAQAKPAPAAPPKGPAPIPGIVAPHQPIHANAGVSYIPPRQAAAQFIPFDGWDGKVPDGPVKSIGPFTWSNAPPVGEERRLISVDRAWVKQNINERVEIPQLRNVKGGMHGIIPFHHSGSQQLQALWAEWEQEGLLKFVETFDGAWVPRYSSWKGYGKRLEVPDTEKKLSNHSFGTAFDINCAWNLQGDTPAPVTAKGTVLPLIKIANKHGFYWGGEFSTPDGMHFELGKLIAPQA